MCELTKDKLNALRKCHGWHIYATEFETTITCDMESSMGRKYDDVARCKFGLGLATRIEPGKRAFVSMSSARHDPCWATITQLLRVGDKLSLSFRPDWFTNNYVKAAGGVTEDGVIFEGLHADVCYLHVDRESKSGRRRLTFLLDSSICPDNTARMIASTRGE